MSEDPADQDRSSGHVDLDVRVLALDLRLDQLHVIEDGGVDLAIAEASIDLVVSSISLHHVSDKAVLYRDIKSWLAPGGEFWFADQFAGATEKIHQRNWDDWLVYCRRDGGCTEKEIEDLLEHASVHDHYTPVVVHFEMLRNTGFAPESFDCVWRNLIWGIIGARRL